MKTPEQVQLSSIHAAVVCALLNVFVASAPGQSIYSTIKYFGFPQRGVSYPSGFVTDDAGVLYSTSQFGGELGFGTVFRINRDGTGLGVLKSFGNAEGTDGTYPGALMVSADGRLYGTTWSGGMSNVGTVFRLNRDGTGYEILRHFTGTFGDGANPAAGLLQAPSGALYSTTSRGGTDDQGTIFRLNGDGTAYQTVWSFTGEDGAKPLASLIQGRDEMLYGTTAEGGTYNRGTVLVCDLTAQPTKC